jgi:RND family efflux transporter MFP subunit
MDKVLNMNIGKIRITGALLMTCVIALTACSKPSESTVRKLTPVRVEQATNGPSAPPIRTNGIVATKDEMRLSFKVGGIIKSIRVEEGQTVHQGDVLAEIEQTEINAQVEQAQQLAEKAKRDLERGERLYTDQVISLEQLQDLRTQAAMQTAQLKSAKFNRGYSVITAPQDAVVLRKLAQERELIPAAQPVLLLGARDNGYVVRTALADREIVQLKLGDAADIRMDAFPGKSFHGTLTEIGSAADDGTGMFPIEVRLDSLPQKLASGLVAKLNVYPSEGQASQLTYVPIGAVVEGDGDRASVFVIDGDRAKRKPVKIAFIGDDHVALREGLKAGESVVTDGALYLEEDEHVEVVQSTAKVADSAGPTPN